jgi:hypothetical protein
MKWERRGRIYVPDGSRRWARSHAFPPTPYLRDDGVLRIYVSSCDDVMVGRLGFVDVDPANPSQILGIAHEPILDTGADGAFDENGVIPLSVVRVEGRLFLYYVGFQLGKKVRYYQFTGLAVSTDGGESFSRISRVPVLDRTDAESFTRGSAFVVRDSDCIRFRMWYAAGSSWTMVGDKDLPVYNIRHLESADGIHWPEEGRVCIDFASDDEHAFGRPWVLRSDGLYRMFYSVRTRSRGYRIGYAESDDGIRWTRKDDEAGIDVSSSGWDSETISYAAVIRHGGVTTMFYCGNGLGRTGFGYAELVEE